MTLLFGYYRSHAASVLDACRWWRYWLHSRPLLAGSLTVIALVWLLSLMSTAPAFAAAASGDAGSITDTQGVPLAAYGTLPIDGGGLGALVDPGTGFSAMLMSLFWGFVHQITVGVLNAFAFVFSFDWVLWLAMPFVGFAELMGQMLGSGAGIAAMLSITALIGGTVALFGRIAAGFMEMALAVIASALLVGALSNPTLWLVGDNGAFTTVAGWARELASLTASEGRSSTQTLAASVTMPMAEIALRSPYQHAAFGQELTGNCARVLDRALIAGDDPTAVRDQVRGCNPEAADHAESPNAVGLAQMVAGSYGRGGALLPVAIGVVTVSLTALTVLLDSVRLLAGLYIALLPLSKRTVWRGGIGMIVGMLSLLVQVVLVVGWGKAVVDVIKTGEQLLPFEVLQHMLGALFFGLTVLLVWVAWNIYQRGKALAEKAATAGLNSKPVKPLPVDHAVRAAEAVHRIVMDRRLRSGGGGGEALPAAKAVTQPSKELATVASSRTDGAAAPGGRRPPAGGPSSAPRPAPAPGDGGGGSAPPRSLPEGAPQMQEGVFERVPRRRAGLRTAGRVAASATKIAVTGALSGGSAAIVQGAFELGGAAVSASSQRARRVVPDPQTGVATITSLRREVPQLPPGPSAPSRALAPTAAELQLRQRLQEARR